MFRWLYRTGLILFIIAMLIVIGLWVNSYRRADALTFLLHTDTSYRLQADRGRFEVYTFPHLGDKTYWYSFTHYTPKPGATRLDKRCTHHAWGFGYTGQKQAGHIWPGGGDRMVDIFQLVVPAWAMLVFWTLLFAAYIAAVRRIRRTHRRRHGLCTRCGYDMRASPDACPECGKSK